MAGLLIRIFGSTAIGYLFMAGAALVSVGGVALWWNHHNQKMIDRGKYEATLKIRKATDDAKARGVRRKARIEIEDAKDAAKVSVGGAMLRLEEKKRRRELQDKGDTGELTRWLNKIGGAR